MTLHKSGFNFGRQLTAKNLLCINFGPMFSVSKRLKVETVEAAESVVLRLELYLYGIISVCFLLCINVGPMFSVRKRNSRSC